MANVLKMARAKQIVELYRQGWSQRNIASQLHVNRETVSRYIQLETQTGCADPPEEPSKPANPLTGSEASKPATPVTGTDSKPANLLTGSDPSASGKNRSKCEPYRALIIEKLEAGLSAQRIFQDLSTEHQFSGHYHSVQRMVRRLSLSTPLPFRRMECAPGAEAQIDFGPGVGLLDADGRRRRTHVLRIVLSHSRKSYSEAVLRQSTDDLMRCLENAFWSWGGVPKTLVVDNLKAAVQQADWYDPELNPKLQSFCQHYGTVLLPTKPYMPRHKGKVESGVKYVSRNALKGHTFASLSALNSHLSAWEERVADLRIHGTTKRQVRDLFESAERSALLALPKERFPSFHEQQRVAHRDAHVEVAKAYYSVPPEYVSRTVWVRWDERLVRIFNSHWKLIALHARAEPGTFRTDHQHLAAQKISSVERGSDRLLHQARHIGPQTGHWAEAMLKSRGIQGVRALVGLLALARRTSPYALERACALAREHGSFRLRVLRALVKRKAPRQAEMDFMTEHPIIRRLDDYGTLVRVSFQDQRPWREPPISNPEEENQQPHQI